MTKREAFKFLIDKKLYTNGNNEQILDKLFSVGFTYAMPHSGKYYLNPPFFFIHTDNTITYSSDVQFFKKHEYEEISELDILNININSYRPFKNSEECFKEMSKHTPVGWVKDAGKYADLNMYTLFTHITDEGLFSNGIVTNFLTAFEDFKFIDGTPFGIKEN